MAHAPTQLEPLDPTALLIAWNSGEKFSVPYTEMRFNCPCASCVDEHTGQRIIRRESVPSDIRPTNVQPVGRYAIQFTWTDGHGTGIYHYDTLWKICEKQGQKLN